MFEAKTLRNLLICTSITTCVFYIFQISFGVSALARFYDPGNPYDINLLRSQVVGMKMIEFFMFLFFSIFLALGLCFKREFLWVNILGYALLIGLQMYTTLASFDTTPRFDVVEIPNYCQLLDDDESAFYIGAEVGRCRTAIASGFFILLFNIISLFLTVGILQKKVEGAKVALAIAVEEENVEKVDVNV